MAAHRLLTILVLILILCCAVRAHAQSPTTAEPQAEETAADGRTGSHDGPPTTIDPVAFVPEQLATPVTVTFDDTPLIDVAEWLEETSQVPVLLDEAAFEEEGIPIDVAVTDELLGDPLYLLLDRLSSLDLTWIIQDDILHITTHVVGEEILTTEPYDVGDLFNMGYEPQAIIDTIQLATDGPYADIDGPGGVLEWLGDVLFVRQTARVHRQVRGLLMALRQHGSETFCFEPPQNLEFREKLNTIVTADFQHEPLSAAISQLASQANVDIRLDLRALREEGLRDRFLVSLKLSERNLGTVLDVLLAPFACTTLMRDGVLWVTTDITAEEEMKSVVYDVSDLCANEDESRELADAITDQTSGPWFGGGGAPITFPIPQTMVIRQHESCLSEVRNLLAMYREALATATPRERKQIDPKEIVTKYYRINADTAADLMTVLPLLVSPGSWADAQNPELPGRILKVASGKNYPYSAENSPKPDSTSMAVLIVRQTRVTHEEITEVLMRVEQGDSIDSDMEAGGFGGGGIGIGGFFSLDSINAKVE